MEYEYEIIQENVFYVPKGESVLEALAKWHYRCKRAGGRPVYKTSFGGKLPEGTLIVACMFKGREVPGGKVSGVPKDFWEAIDKAPRGQKWKVAEEYYKTHGIGPYKKR